MVDEPFLVQVEVAGEDADAEELERLTHQLRAELLELDVESVEVASGGAAPDGTKATDIAAWGSLLVTLAGAGGVLPVVIETVRSWLTRHSGQTVMVKVGDAELQLSGATAQERQELVSAWVRAVQTQ